jgi:predicted RNA methylase
MRDCTETIKETSATTPWSRKLYNKKDFWENSEGLHYAYLVYRTLRGEYKDFQPDSIFYVGKSPAAYLKKVENISDEVIGWQRFLWNQAVVPLLIVQSKTKVQVYTAYTPPTADTPERLESILDTVADALELNQILTMIEAGTLYEVKPEAFHRSQGVDQYLLRNLNAAATQMAETQDGGKKKQENLEFVHRFLTRLLFVCYLIERGMIKGEHFEDESLAKLQPKSDSQEGYFLRHLFNDLSSYTKRKEALCKIFARVKDRFNGSLFPENGVTGEKDRYNEDFIRELNRFLQGDDIQDKQSMLPFWTYDFSVIPIETISAIYEGFIGEQGKLKELQGGKDSQKTSGAYYTPLHLAELTVDIALENVKKPIHELKVLDPACGSGVFLVSLFGRMAESLRREDSHYSQRKLAIEMSSLMGKLYGIDVNPTACHITCFSLYLALLEQLAPIDIEDLCEYNKNKKALIPLLFPHPEGYNTIYHGNLFDPHLSLERKDFDIVIGNPPWVSRENQKDKIFLEWLGKKPIDIFGPNKQIAHGFMWKTIDCLSGSGQSCLLLPVAVLLNNSTNKFQKEWLKYVTIERVINLSDLSFFLFENADRPCVAIKFKKGRTASTASILYETPNPA